MQADPLFTPVEAMVADTASFAMVTTITTSSTSIGAGVDTATVSMQ